MVTIGYKISSTNLSEIMEKLESVKKKIKKIAEDTYHNLLGKEIAFITDNIALSILKRNEGTTIFDDAIRNLNHNIDIARQTGARTKFNFQIYAHVMPYENNTYLKVTCMNKDYLKAFSIFEDYSLTGTECQDNPKTILWQQLYSIYGESEPIIIDLTQYVSPDKEKIIYPKKKDRAKTVARHNIVNHLLNQISNGQQIAPFLLMPYMDIAMEMLADTEIQSEYNRKVSELLSILPDLNNKSNFIFENE